MTDCEHGMQQSAKLAMQEERKIREEREALALRKNKELQKKIEISSMPQSTLKLRPTHPITQENQRLSRAMILQLSKDLRNTHQPNPFALSFQMMRPNLDDEKNKKIRAAAKLMQQRQLTQINYLKHVATEEAYEQQHRATVEHSVEHSHMSPTPRPRYY